jgi:hypothetical protein
LRQRPEPGQTAAAVDDQGRRGPCIRAPHRPERAWAVDVARLERDPAGELRCWRAYGTYGTPRITAIGQRTTATGAGGRKPAYGAATPGCGLLPAGGARSLRKDLGRALLAGFVGWVVFTLVLLMAPLMGVPPMNVPQMLGGMFGMNSLFMGWVMHLMIGLALGAIYVYWFADWLPGAPWARGLLFGVAPWLVMMAMVAPMLPALDPMLAKMPPGFFFANMGLMAIMGSLVAHLAYGVVTGAVYGAPRPVAAPRAAKSA